MVSSRRIGRGFTLVELLVVIAIIGTSEHAYCSTHSGGMGALFCDGSVHFLSEAIDGEALEILAQRASGLPLPSGAFW